MALYTEPALFPRVLCSLSQLMIHASEIFGHLASLTQILK